jgi:hypothetical protein
MAHLLLNPRVREVACVIGRKTLRGLKLLEALLWFSVGVGWAWLSWAISAMPDDKVMRFFADVMRGYAAASPGGIATTLAVSAARNLFLGFLVAAVLLAVYGLSQIRQWFRLASNKESN